MQVASNPFSAPIHSHYHSYYHLHPPGPQDHDLKRQYLALLPPQQIIEICLTFDLHVPPYVKSTIWPPDISAAIARLRPPPQPQVSEQKATKEPSKDGEAVMDSLKSPTSPEPSPTRQESAHATELRPPDKEGTSSPGPSTAPSLPPVAGSSTLPPQPAQSTSSSSSGTETLEIAAPVQPTQPTPAALPAPSQPPQGVAQPQYPHQHYAYAHPQAAYPHAPYYPPHPAGYSYPYASYAAPMQNAYHPQAPPAYPPQPSMYNSMMALTHPPQHDGVLADDLPSYEEMIVEALTGCVDPEGWAPKDLFAWMASRYPLQSNFRPSASQALQKAFKRGRFEKSSNGKYRLNATWNGGNTSRRTTRRPQTQNTQSTPGSSTPAPPFTNAPLVHHNHGHASTSSHAATGQTYQPTPYGYTYTGMAYSGFSAQPQASSSTAPGASTSSTDANDAKAAAAASSDSDTAAAYEAAQNILNAINFGSLYQLAPEEQGEHAGKDERQADQPQAGVGSGVEELLSHVQAMLASAEAGAGASGSGPSSLPGPGGSVGAVSMMPPPPPPDSASDPRAELQAQLALLAAQLAELAKVEDATDLQQQQQQQQLLPTPAAVHMPAPAPVPAPIHAPTPIAAAPSLADVSDIPEALPEEDEESDDDDMEEVI